MSPTERPVAGDARLGWWLFGAVLLIVAAGLLYLGVAPEHWLRGVFVVGAAMVFGAVARAVVPTARAGPLAVRTRWFDVACYLAAGVSTAGFALVVR